MSMSNITTFTIVTHFNLENAIQINGRHGELKIESILSKFGLETYMYDYFVCHVGEAISKPIGTGISSFGNLIWTIEEHFKKFMV